MNPSRIRVKMCGMTRSEDIQYAIDLGVDAIGLIFYPKSARNVSLEKARIIVNNIPPFVDIVAVLVNPEQSFVQLIINEIPVQLLQFHGEESSEFCRQFNKPFIKATHPKTAIQIQSAVDEFFDASAILLDTPSDKERGGTGLTFDWNIIPENLSKPYILAGGLNESNILEAITMCNPYAVDVCSGIEASPGVKDHLKMSRFIKAIWG
ncbi:TPA: phosphoribosylanthranilate isomerase [Legionella pneumophila]|uniref:phosphoribosylanthranilate isomerase n=1 Tax=Legionella sp. PATHC039 TaxID=2992042 RepID=UPI0007781978|nr:MULTISPECIES: phosphoribosylanthranilate isomerase [Legionella]HAT8857882.1 phosphoribosylanthranilate isomerase [Legionella pneumophila subsp. pneumophila]MCW8395219.1 phosphoribosylanthranilate isomerase [Legionella sp. PATHC039]HAT8641129.1 phosphoribosylanthranilate isomerase [Legionella pneumophila]HAT9649923.1 phosphoribosylanthranilate isomerase [Legionella pneumophila subsp. pneumophila]HAT9921553.1 phosphoribosylanthranilate isomerase [Legionella pneumophila subsp. pneumophila]